MCLIGSVQGFTVKNNNDLVTGKQNEQVVSISLKEQMGHLSRQKELCVQKQKEPPPDTGTYCSVAWDQLMCWNLTPAGTVAKQSCPDYVNGLTSAGFATRECLVNGTWKPNSNFNASVGWTDYSGCISKSIDLSGHLTRIQLISEIGYGISLASLSVAVLIMFLSKRLHCKSNSLHINLFFAFILRAAVSFIKNMVLVEGLGLEKDIIRKNGTIEFKEEGTHWECKLLVTVFLYTVSASIMWIFMEGLYLHMLVYRTLFTERHGIRLYVILGWVSPLLCITPWVIVRIFLENELCWNINEKDGYFWIIRGPIHLIILINFVFFIDIVRVLCIRMKSHRHAQGSSAHFRKLAKFAVVLLPLFGVVYIGFSLHPTGLNVESDIIYLYCEMFYNSFQGFILALLFCFLNEEVHNEIRMCLYRRRFDGFNSRTIFLSSWRKNSNMSRVTLPRDPHVTETDTNSDAHVIQPRSKGNKGVVHVHWKTSKLKSKDQEKNSAPGNRRYVDYNRITSDTEMSNSTFDHV